MSPELLIAVLAAGAVLLITYGVAARPSEDAVQARLSQLVVQPKTLAEMELQQPFYDRVIRPTIQRLSRAGRRQEGGAIARIDAKLERAGYPGGLRGADWVGVKLLALIGFAVLGLLLGLLLTGGNFVVALLFLIGGAGTRPHSPSFLVGRQNKAPRLPRSSRRWRARSWTNSGRHLPKFGWAGRAAMPSATWPTGPTRSR